MRTTRRPPTTHILHKAGCSSLLDSSFLLLTFLLFLSKLPFLYQGEITHCKTHYPSFSLNSRNPHNSNFFSLDLMFSCMFLLLLVLFSAFCFPSSVFPVSFPFSPPIACLITDKIYNRYFLTDSARRLGTLDYTFLSRRPPDLSTDVLFLTRS